MEITNLRTYIKVKLGHSDDADLGVTIELAQDQLDVVIQDTLLFYNTHQPLIRRKILNVSSGIFQYDVNSIIGSRGSVIECVPNMNATITDYNDIFAITDRTQNRSAVGYYLDLKDFQTTLDIHGSTFDWEFERDPVANTAYLYIRAIAQVTQVSYLYATEHTLDTIPAHDEYWINEYSLQLAKLLLGEMRGKFGEVQGQQSPLNLNADTIKSDATTRKETLESELRGRGKMIQIHQG